MKIVGIISRSQLIGNKEFIGCYTNYVKKIKKDNIIPIIIPENSELSILSICDGIISPGGDSVSEFDRLVLDYVIKKDIPYLGICLGMQVLGSKLNFINNHYLKEHYVYIKRDSLLYDIYKCDHITVNSRHHEAVTSTKYFVSALSQDNIIEAIEIKNKKFILGVQWHPEDLESNTLFNFFTNKL